MVTRFGAYVFYGKHINAQLLVQFKCFGSDERTQPSKLDGASLETALSFLVYRPPLLLLPECPAHFTGSRQKKLLLIASRCYHRRQFAKEIVHEATMDSLCARRNHSGSVRTRSNYKYGNCTTAAAPYFE
jgi:hypothetical protein